MSVAQARSVWPILSALAVGGSYVPPAGSFGPVRRGTWNTFPRRRKKLKGWQRARLRR